MKYYKMIKDNMIIGAISSDNFMHYSSLTDCYLRADEQTGEYVSYKGKFYRSGWMQPYSQKERYEEVAIVAITIEEYNIYIEAFKVQDEIEEAQEIQPEEPTADPENPVDRASIEFIRQSKLSEMSYTCRTTIEAGFDLELRGEMHHFSLDTQDQLNLISLSAMAQTQELIPYHADGEECIFYTAAEINAIVEKATAFKIYHTTYYNALKTYINALNTIESISAITYGTSIPEEYKSDVLRALEQ